MGIVTEDEARIRWGVTFIGKKFKMEKDVLINYNVFIDCQEQVTLKKGCALAFGVNIITSTHEIGPSNRRKGKSIRKPITIGEGCWVGAGVTILPGVTIGKGCIIAAGAVVNKDCEPNGIYAGIPARRIRDLG